MQLIRPFYPRCFALSFSITALLFSSVAFAGGQIYIPLSASVRTAMQQSISDQAPLRLAFATQGEADFWLKTMSDRLKQYLPDVKTRTNFLKTVHYEATRAGLDPQLVLALIEVESSFNKYAVSRSGARGYMQVMPFWVREIGVKGHDLFHLNVNLRYGCTILRYYLDLEKGNLFRALGRYNGTLGQPEYPNQILAAWRNHWSFATQTFSTRHTPPS